MTRIMMLSLRKAAVSALLIAGLAVAGAGSASADEAAWAALREPGTHLLMRHAVAPGTGDPAGFTLGDCSTQRNLDARGKAQASAIGEALRAEGVALSLVLTSQWCRARDTAARLGVARIEDEPALNSFFEDRAGADAATAGTLRRLSSLPAGSKIALVTHQVNVTALTGVYPSSGEMVVISIGEDGGIDVRGRIKIP